MRLYVDSNNKNTKIYSMKMKWRLQKASLHVSLLIVMCVCVWEKSFEFSPHNLFKYLTVIQFS